MSRVGKITIYVDQTTNGQTLAVRTTGRVGSLNLNTVSADQAYSYKTSTPDAKSFWEAILALSTAVISALP